MRICNGSDQVGRPGARCRHAHPNPTGSRRVAFGRMARGLLVADKNVPNLGGVHQRVVGGQNGTARNTEDDVNIGIFKGANQTLRTGDGLGGFTRARHRTCLRHGVGHFLVWANRADEPVGKNCGETTNPPTRKGSEGARG